MGAPPGEAARRFEGRTVVRHEVEGRSGLFVVGERFWSLSGRVPAPAEFAVDERGRIFRIARQRRDHGGVRVRLCGCAPPRCSFVSGCPGCGQTVRRLYGPLPEGTCYAGELRIAYEAPRFVLEHEGGRCGPCPPPPPSMRR